MIINNITIDDLVGVEFFRFSNSHPLDFDKYFSCVKSMRPLFKNPDFKDSTSGFYINYITNSEGGNSVRLTYFTKNGKKTKEAINNFQNTNRSNIILFRSSDRKESHASRVSSGYGGEELRFRKFLNTYTHIGLDLLDYDILYSRRLVAEYRTTYSTRKIPSRPLFKPAFTQHSQFFNKLDASGVEQLWKDLDYWHSVGATGFVTDWTHFLVNMLLPGDWNNDPEFNYLFMEPVPRPPIVGEEKARMLRKKGLYMPENWNSAENSVEIKK